MHGRPLPRLSILTLALLLLANASVTGAATANGVLSIDHIVAERVKHVLPEGDQPRMRVVDDRQIGLFGTTAGLPIDAVRQTRSARDLDVLVKLKLIQFMPRHPVKLKGAAAVAAYIASATISNYVENRDSNQQLFYYHPSAADNAPIDPGEDREMTAQLAGLLTADGCGARTIALLRRIGAGSGQGTLTAAAVDARGLLKRLGGGAYYPTDGCDAPETDGDYMRAIAAIS